jgi:hypothetical protein
MFTIPLSPKIVSKSRLHEISICNKYPYHFTTSIIDKEVYYRYCTVFQSVIIVLTVYYKSCIYVLLYNGNEVNKTFNGFGFKFKHYT